jgi:hypothetical protein
VSEIAGGRVAVEFVGVSPAASSAGGEILRCAQNDSVVVEDRRQGFYMVENAVMDWYLPLMGLTGYAVYSLYCRLANNREDVAWPSFRTVCSHLRIGPATLTQVNTLLEVLGLIEVERGDQETSNRYYLLEVQPLADEVKAAIRERAVAAKLADLAGLLAGLGSPSWLRQRGWKRERPEQSPLPEGGASESEAGCFSVGSRVLLVQKQGASVPEAEQNKQQHQRNVDPENGVVGDGVLSELLAFGVERKMAVNLVMTVGEERIRGWLEYTRVQKNLRNPAGFLITRLESGDKPP